MGNIPVIVVTGADRGIGLAIATGFARKGAYVVLHGLADESLQEQLRACILQSGAKDVLYVPADLRDVSAIEGMIAAALAWQGRVDILVNNAGMQYTAPFGEMPVGVWDSILAVNLSAAYHLVRGFLPGMLAAKWGRVVNIASVHGLVASVNKAPYVASKFGIIGLTKALALETAGTGVTVNAVCPGWVETALIEPQIQARADKIGGDRAAGMRDLVLEKQPSGQMSQPEDIAAAVQMLCEPWAHNMTGIALPIDGGWTAQ